MHVVICYCHVIREARAADIVIPFWLKGMHNLADIMTKQMSDQPFLEHINNIYQPFSGFSCPDCPISYLRELEEESVIHFGSKAWICAERAGQTMLYTLVIHMYNWVCIHALVTWFNGHLMMDGMGHKRQLQRMFHKSYFSKLLLYYLIRYEIFNSH